MCSNLAYNSPIASFVISGLKISISVQTFIVLYGPRVHFFLQPTLGVQICTSLTTTRRAVHTDLYIYTSSATKVGKVLTRSNIWFVKQQSFLKSSHEIAVMLSLV